MATNHRLTAAFSFARSAGKSAWKNDKLDNQKTRTATEANETTATSWAFVFAKEAEEMITEEAKPKTGSEIIEDILERQSETQTLLAKARRNSDEINKNILAIKKQYGDKFVANGFAWKIVSQSPPVFDPDRLVIVLDTDVKVVE